MAQFNFVFKELQQVHQEYQSLLNEVEQVDDEDWFEEVGERVFAFKHKVHQWLKQVELEHENGSRSSSKSSKSKKSSASRSSGKTKSSSSGSSKNRAMEQKAKFAELMAEAEFLERRQQAENEAQKLKTEEKLPKAKGRSQVFEDMQDSLLLKSRETAKEVGISHEATKVRTNVDVHQFSGKIQNPPTRMKMDDTRTSHQEPLLRSSLKKPREVPSSSNEITGDISRMLCNLLRQQPAPDVDIPVFTGNPLEYHYFMSSFKEAVECKIDDPHGRLVCLLKFTVGEAKETIQHFIQQPPEVGYRLTKTLLEEHDGNPHRMLVAYRKEIKSWAPLKQGDSSSYRKFYNFLIKCDSIMSLKQWNALDTPDKLCSLISKLPGNTRGRWNR